MGRTCLSLGAAQAALVAAGGVVAQPAHRQLAPQVDRRVAVDELKGIELEASKVAVGGVVRGIGRISDASRKK